MKILHVVLMGLCLLFIAGCGPKCMPRPKAQAVVMHTKKLPFRISGLSFEAAPKDEQTEGGLFMESYMLAGIGTISKQALYESAVVNKDSESVVSVRVYIKRLEITGQSIWKDELVYYSARYDVVDIESGKVLMSKVYDSEQPYDYKSSAVCSPLPEGIGAIQVAVNDVTNRFIEDLYAVSPPVLDVDDRGRIDGTMEFVSTAIPYTRDNLSWLRLKNKQRMDDGCLFSYFFMGRLITDLPAAVSKAIGQKGLFNHSTNGLYKITIVVPEIDARSGGWFTEPVNFFTADAVIYKDGVEVGNVELDQSEYDEHDSFESVVDLYTSKILNKLEAMAMEGE